MAQGMEDLGGGAAAGLATAAGPEEAAGTPDWVAQFRCVCHAFCAHPAPNAVRISVSKITSSLMGG